MFGSLIHRALRGERTIRPAFWFMRQAGRYLPEYRELRKKAGGFLTLCYTPKLAAEVTLQPLRRFDMDGAIIFSDILVIPHAMGVNLSFAEGEGPRLTPTRTRSDVEKLKINLQHLAPVAEAIRRVRKELPAEKALIGFCGAPWTVACYMVEGQSSPDYARVRDMAREDRETFSLLIDTIIASSVSYLCMQVEAGADVIQIFDSWAGVLDEDEYKTWVIAPTRKLVAGFKAKHPTVPVIGFPRGSGAKLKYYATETGVDAVSVDTQTQTMWAKDNVAIPLQGNLDPEILATDKKAAVAATRKIIADWRDRPFIFNLGHGIVPATPIENVQAVCDVIRESA